MTQKPIPSQRRYVRGGERLKRDKQIYEIWKSRRRIEEIAARVNLSPVRIKQIIEHQKHIEEEGINLCQVCGFRIIPPSEIYCEDCNKARGKPIHKP